MQSAQECVVSIGEIDFVLFHGPEDGDDWLDERFYVPHPPGVFGLHPIILTISEILKAIRENQIFVAASSAAAIAFYKGLPEILKHWVAARNGRKLKIKVGDIEVEATQMRIEEVLRIFERLQQKNERDKITLLDASGRPSTTKSETK